MSSVKHIVLLLLIASLWSTEVLPQSREYQIHRRGMLHQTIFNTGEVGRGYDNGTAGITEGFPSMEWPPNSSMILDRTVYPGQHNSFGGGIWLGVTRPSGRQYAYCGAVSDANGNPVPVLGLYSNPISIERIENYPLLPNGDLNPAFNPDEAEERIVSRWTTPVGVRVTRTSRAWSYPGYDSFIIYDYQLENTTADTMKDVHAVWTYGIGPSMFGYQRTYNRWGEGDFRGQNGEGNHFGRFDLKRWMVYSHERDGRPDTVYFNQWSGEGDRGGLNSPQAAGVLMLYYDYDHLARRNETEQFWLQQDSIGAWDDNGRMKQPFMLRYENGNLPTTKVQLWMDPRERRKTSTFQRTTNPSTDDSVRFITQYGDPSAWPYWKGRTKGSTNLSWYQPVVRSYGFAPYMLPPGGTMTFVLAELVGYGAGVAGDRVYKDLGGNVRAGVDAGFLFNPVSSWYDTLQYQHLGTRPFIGSRYLQDHPLPWYVTPGVVSIRDVADRAIEMYTGRPLVKHDTLQYDPLDMRYRNGAGLFNTVPIPVPAPIISVKNARSALNQIVWGPQVEDFSEAMANGRLRAPFSHYLAMRATSPLGPWAVMDSVAKRDPRFFRDSVYVFIDTLSVLGEFVTYAVVSVDSLGGRSGMTNMINHETLAPAAPSLGKVYVVPNPLVVTNNIGRGSDPRGEITDRLQFFGLTKRCTIRIFSYSGQLIQTIEHDRDSYGNPWYQISRNNQLLASGVYFFVVEDEGGATSRGKFVVIH